MKTFSVCFSLHRYYSMEVSYFKSSLDSHLLDLLWNKYWVNTLSTCSILTVSVFVCVCVCVCFTNGPTHFVVWLFF